MSISGDLATLELADLLQNLESHKRTGVLRVESDDDVAHLYFQDGSLTLFSREERADLMDVLVASGTIAKEQLEAARKKRKRSRKSLGEVLVQMEVLTADTLFGIASSRLLDEACELVAAKSGAFTFEAGEVPRGVFDSEERRLGLRLPAGPLLMESARREDHWELIRQRVPSDGVHFFAKGKPRKLEPGQITLAESVLPMLDGSASVTEVVAAFPHRRFEVYQLLSDLVDERAIRAAGGDDWLTMIEDARKLDPERAKRLLQRALSANPHHIDLLTAKVALAQDMDELELAVESIKMVVHLAFESGDTERARRELARARELAPGDPAFFERAIELALNEERVEDAVRDGLLLVELWRKPGLHAKAVALLERLHALRPQDFKLLSELARSRADCGELEAGVALLLTRGEEHLAARDDDGARMAFDALLALDPKNAPARERIAALDSGDLVRARTRRDARVRRAKVVAVLVALLGCIAYECLARRALIEANSAVARERMIEEQRYDEAAERYAVVVDRFPLSITARWNTQRRLSDLALKGGEPASRR